MWALITGLCVFFLVHFYSAFRSRAPERDIKTRIGEGPYMGLYSLASIIGLGLIIYGYWSSPSTGLLYTAPYWTRMIAQIAMIPAMVLIVAANIPRNHIRQWVRHPMVLSILLWSGSHLIASTDLKELLLFGSFFVFAVVDGISAYRRPQPENAKASFVSDLIVLFVAALIYTLFMVWLHVQLFNVSIL